MSENTPLLHPEHASTKRLLSPNIASIVAIGSTIGTGLFFSIRNVLIQGPLISLAAFSYIAIICVIIVHVTNELSYTYPVNGSLCQFQSRFLSPAIGFSNSIIYWISWGLTLALELSILVSILRYWWPETHNLWPGLVLWGLLTAINLLPVNIFGYAEFSISIIKIVSILAWIVLVVAALGGANPKHEFIGLNVWTSNWPHSFTGPPGSLAAKFADLWSCLITASFSFQSVESIALTSGEIKNPSKKSFKQITRLIVVRIIVFYVVSLLFLTLSVPYNDPQLLIENDLLSSPFLIALTNLYFNSNLFLSAFNFIIFTAILSAAASNIYFGSRSLLAIAESLNDNKWKHHLLYTTKSGVPVTAVLYTSAFGVFSLVKADSFEFIFNTLIHCSASAGLLMWCLLCWSYKRYSGNSKKKLVRAAEFAGVNIALVLLTSGLKSAWNSQWHSFVSSYLTIGLFGVVWAMAQCVLGGKWLIPLENIDFYTDRQI